MTTPIPSDPVSTISFLAVMAFLASSVTHLYVQSAIKNAAETALNAQAQLGAVYRTDRSLGNDSDNDGGN